MNIDRDWRSLNLHVKGKETKRLPPVEGIATFFTIYAWPDASFSGLAKERSRWDRQLGSYCPFVPGSRAYLHPVLCIWHPALVQRSIPPKSPKGPVAALHSLLHQLAADKLLLNISHSVLMVSTYSCILPMWQSRSALCFSFISPSIPRWQCQIAQVANTDRECFATVTAGFYDWLEVSLQDDSEQSFFLQLIKIKSMFWT